MAEYEELSIASEYHPAADVAAGKSSPEDSLKNNSLAIDAIFMQEVRVLEQNKVKEFKESITTYANKLLNDQKFGIVFYKAHIYSNSDVKQEDSIRIGDMQPNVEYILHFHTFAVEYLTKDKVQEIQQHYLPDLLDSEGHRIAEVTDTKLVVHEGTDHRKPVYS